MFEGMETNIGLMEGCCVMLVDVCCCLSPLLQKKKNVPRMFKNDVGFGNVRRIAVFAELDR